MSNRNKGITIIEILVVLFVILILAALLTVAVQSARNAAYRTQCANNLRQLGLAANHYISQFDVLPQTGRGALSFHAILLPYLEHKPIYDAINFQLGFMVEVNPANSTCDNTKIEVFMCPSEKQLSWATCNFPGNSGTGFQKFGFNGLFSTPRHPSVSYRSITDGATNTSIFSEWVIGPAAYVKDNPRRFVFATPAPPLLESNDFDAFVKLCRQMTSEDIRSDPAGKGKSWLRGDFKHTLYNHVISINGNSCTNSGFVRQGAWTAGSLHSQGANVVFVDGHSRFIKDSVALTVWRSLGSRNGGEAVSNDSF